MHKYKKVSSYKINSGGWSSPQTHKDGEHDTVTKKPTFSGSVVCKLGIVTVLLCEKLMSNGCCILLD